MAVSYRYGLWMNLSRWSNKVRLGALENTTLSSNGLMATAHTTYLLQFSHSSNNPRDDIATEAYEDELDMGRSGSYLNSSINSAWSEHSLDPEDIRVRPYGLLCFVTLVQLTSLVQTSMCRLGHVHELLFLCLRKKTMSVRDERDHWSNITVCNHYIVVLHRIISAITLALVILPILNQHFWTHMLYSKTALWAGGWLI